jgi:hypothetical protein
MSLPFLNFLLGNLSETLQYYSSQTKIEMSVQFAVLDSVPKTWDRLKGAAGWFSEDIQRVYEKVVFKKNLIMIGFKKKNLIFSVEGFSL